MTLDSCPLNVHFNFNAMIVRMKALESADRRVSGASTREREIQNQRERVGEREKTHSGCVRGGGV
jgi:hypothetical protein